MTLPEHVGGGAAGPAGMGHYRQATQPVARLRLGAIRQCRPFLPWHLHEQFILAVGGCRLAPWEHLAAPRAHRAAREEQPAVGTAQRLALLPLALRAMVRLVIRIKRPLHVFIGKAVQVDRPRMVQEDRFLLAREGAAQSTRGLPVGYK